MGSFYMDKLNSNFIFILHSGLSININFYKLNTIAFG